jgi:hypothetical protein
MLHRDTQGNVREVLKQRLEDLNRPWTRANSLREAVNGAMANSGYPYPEWCNVSLQRMRHGKLRELSH